MAAVMLEDITKPLYKKAKRVNMDDKLATFISKIFGKHKLKLFCCIYLSFFHNKLSIILGRIFILALSFGLLTIVLAYLFSLAGQEILGVALSLFGMVGGPMLGLFSLAMFFRCSNSVVGA